jgi:hypothetical protein
MINFNATNPEPISPVTVSRHPVDWDSSIDLDEVTALRASSLGNELTWGCWYLNPRFTVYSPAPTTEFFHKVLELRSSWLRTTRQALSTPGQRREARKVARQGRLASVPEISLSCNDSTSTQPSPDSLSCSLLTNSKRLEVIQAGRMSKSLAFSGVLFIDGELIPPRTWQTMARDLQSRRSP